MATINFSNAPFALNFNDWGPARLASGTVVDASSTGFTVDGADGLVEVYAGLNLGGFNAEGVPTSGTIIGYQLQSAGGTVLASIQNASVDAFFLTAGDGSSFTYDAEASSTIFGSAFGDEIVFDESGGGLSSIHGGAGNDQIDVFNTSGAGGSINGGGGFNTLSLRAGAAAGAQLLTDFYNIGLSSIQAVRFDEQLDPNNSPSQTDAVRFGLTQLGGGQLAANLEITANSQPDLVLFFGATPGTYDLSQITLQDWDARRDSFQIQVIAPGDYVIDGPQATVSTLLLSDATAATWSHNADGTWTITGNGSNGETVDTVRGVDLLQFNGSQIAPLVAEFAERHDFYGDDRADILFGQSDGALAIWRMDGTAITGGGAIGNPGGTWQEVGIGSFGGDYQAGVLFQDAAHDVAVWQMDGTAIAGGGTIGNPGGTWAVAGVGDFYGILNPQDVATGLSDILFQDASHNLAIWELNGTAIVGGGVIGNPGGTWAVAGIGDFNGDGMSDILFQDATGDLAIWEMDGTSIIGGGDIGAPGGTWQVKGVGDFNGDAKSDILFEDAAGDYAIWELDGASIIGGGDIGNPGGSWQFAGIGDYTGDGMSDILFQDASGNLAIWEMNGTSVIGGGQIGAPGSIWHVLG